MASDKPDNPPPGNGPPISTDPTDPPRLQDMRRELWSATDSNTDATSTWADAPRQTRLPDVMKDQTQTQQGDDHPPQQEVLQAHDIPNILRPGGTNQATSAVPQSAAENPPQHAAQLPPRPAPEQTAYLTGASDSLQPAMTPSSGNAETNPFKRKEVLQDPSPSSSLGQNAATSPPTEAFANMNTGEASTNPWRHGPDEETKPAHAPAPPFPSDLGPDPTNPWQLDPPRQQQALAPSSPTMLSASSGRQSPAWDDLPENQTRPLPSPMSQEANREVNEDRGAWNEGLARDKGDGLKAPVAPGTAGAEPPLDDWSLIDPGSAPSAVQSGEPSRHGTASESHTQPKDKAPEQLVQIDDKPAADSPPRDSTDNLMPRPRPVDSKSETYQIKNINWHDYNADKSPRTSPILVQNANGPCPLLALVNALTLSTPAEMTDTNLVQVLRSREQISLGLLLDAVLDELMSPRRTSEDASLPDVGELYDFLKGLHTGMNVNPRFVPTAESIRAFNRTSLTHLHAVERSDSIPGTFEDTIEMSLYSAFSIPLIHGWLPRNDDPVYDAFDRQATSYDQVQNLLFREEELEGKLSQPDGEGLTEDEQQLYQDIITIRSFLDGSATQLTPWGLETITKAMKPGLFAILFRNDHFSTLYKHPQTHKLLALVTDAGYAGHAEVVWESLADVNGLSTEYFSGDFCVVGGPGGQIEGDASQGADWFDEPSTSAGDQGEWTTVQGRRDKDQAPGDSDMVQEDHDLALAMQLQEEEDERQRNEEARRNHERQLNEQYIEQQSRQSGPNRQPAPPTRGGMAGGRGGHGGGQPSLAGPRTHSSNAGYSAAVAGRRQPGQVPAQQVRPLVPPVIPQRGVGVNRPAGEGVDEAPPTYEQAQHSTPYNPPVGHPSHPSSTQEQAQDTGQNRRPAMRPTMGGPPQSGRGRPMPPGPIQAGSSGRDRDCVVM